MNAFQRFLRRINPVAVYRPLKRPSFDVDESLVSRQLKAAAGRPVNGIRRVIAPQPKPINYDEIGVLE